MDPEKITTV
jgi:hypothetical protein